MVTTVGWGLGVTRVESQAGSQKDMHKNLQHATGFQTMDALWGIAEVWLCKSLGNSMVNCSLNCERDCRTELVMV